jgi:hypothetical protein
MIWAALAKCIRKVAIVLNDLLDCSGQILVSCVLQLVEPHSCPLGVMSDTELSLE